MKCPMGSESKKSNNWLLAMPSKYSDEAFASALRHSGQKGFTNCTIILAENRSKKTIAILHLKKSIRKGQVERLFKLNSQKGIGSLDAIKSKLKSQGYDLFRTLPMYGPEKSTEAKNSENGLAEYSSKDVQRELLLCLKNDAGLDISGCTELPQAVQMVREAVKMLAMRSQILFTNIDDLKDDIKQFLIQINALKDKAKSHTELYEAKLKVQQDQYNELKEQFESLRTRYRRMERREFETLDESSRRIEEWMTKFDVNST